jgi:uncharacterized membrane protein YoaK (UPF0700 family)
MTEVKAAREVTVPLLVPGLLSFVAGYVDSYTYLALFGLFVAQVTGSFVIAGAELVRHDAGVIGKLLAIVAFVGAAAGTAALIALARDTGRAALPWMLLLETLLLAGFVAIVLTVQPASVNDWRGIIAGLFGAMAMGAQSVLVRLLMKGIPQTNVMTGNMTQLGVEITAIILAWRRRARAPRDREAAAEFERVRGQLLIVLANASGFLIGAAAGAVAFVTIGIPGAVLAVVIVAALALWAVYRENSESIAPSVPSR